MNEIRIEGKCPLVNCCTLQEVQTSHVSVAALVQQCCGKMRPGASAAPWAAKMGKGKVGTCH